MADERPVITFDAGTVLSMELSIPVAGGLSAGDEVDLRKGDKKNTKVRTAVVVGIGPAGRPTRRTVVLRLL